MQQDVSWKKIFIRISKLGALGLTLAAIVSTGMVVSTIWEIELKISENKISSNYNVTNMNGALEQGSIIEQQDWEEFSIFLTQDIETNFLEKQGKKYFVKEDFETNDIIKNFCSRVYCLQYKQEFKDIPLYLWSALVGIEDLRFLEHKGVDFIAIARALFVDIISMKFVQGGSTITQQLVKNLFLTNEKTVSRKFKEIIFAFYIENILEKEEILSLYLNEVFWGSFQGIYIKGFYAASLAYFNKPPSKLTSFESTILVSLLKGPNFYKPDYKPERIKARVKTVFRKLKDNGILSKNEKEWTESNWNRWIKSYTGRKEKKYFYNFYHLVNESDQSLGAFENYILLKSINTNLKNYKAKWPEEDIAIKVFIGDMDCEDINCLSKYSYYSKTERLKKEAIENERHQVGSLLKPIIYDYYVTEGKSWDDLIDTSKIILDLKSGAWEPKDYSKVKVEVISLKEALQKSKNIPLIRVASEIGFDKIEEKLIEEIPYLKTPLAEYPAQLLGSVEMSVFELFNMYRKFLNKKCEDINEGKNSFEESILAFLSNAKETTISKVANKKMRQVNIFGKTGTSNLGHDNWYLAFDGNKIYVIWTGVDSNRSQKELYFTGASTSFRIFQEYLLNRGKLIPEVFCD